jgi:hypothetical protein
MRMKPKTCISIHLYKINVFSDVVRIYIYDIDNFRTRITDNLAVVIGLGVGIPLFFIAVLILVVCMVYIKRKQNQRYVHKSSGFNRYVTVQFMLEI